MRKFTELPSENIEAAAQPSKDTGAQIADLRHIQTLKDISDALGCHPDNALRAVNLLKDMLIDASKLIECVNEPCGCAMSSVARAMREAAEGKLPDGGLDEWQHFLKSTEPCTIFQPKKTVVKKPKKAAPKRAVRKSSSTWTEPAGTIANLISKAMTAVKSGKTVQQKNQSIAAGNASIPASKYHTFCKWCGSQFYDRTRRRKFCSKSCSASGRDTALGAKSKACVECGVTFPPLNGGDEHCSSFCRTGKGPGPILPAAPKKKTPAKKKKTVPQDNVRLLHCTSGTSNKFWKVVVSGNIVVTEWGRIGTANPKSRTHSCKYESEAYAYADREIVKKLRKGYFEPNGDRPVFSEHKLVPQECATVGCGEEIFDTWSPGVMCDDCYY
jgi:predicted DNA-binding WGR domain protein